MNNTRIRYTLNPDGTFQSAHVFKAPGGGEYRCMITADGKEGLVLSLPDNTIKLRVKGTSFHKTKIALKAALKSLTVVFLNEKRKDRQTSSDEGAGSGSL